MTDSHQIRAMATVMIAMPSFLILAFFFRSWSRGYAKRLVGSQLTRRQITGRILRAMSWRIALILFVAIPGFLGLAGDSPEEVGTYVGKGIGFGVIAFPLCMLSIWQIARRLSRHAYATAAEEANSADAPRQQLLSIARTLDGTSSEQTSAGAQLITATAYQAGLAAKRLRPTIIEGVVFLFVVMMFAPIPLAIINASKNKKKLAAASASVPTASPVTERIRPIADIPPTPDAPRAVAVAASEPAPSATPKPAPTFSSRTEAAIAQWNKAYPKSPASSEYKTAIQNVETTIGTFMLASNAVDVDAVLESKESRPELVAQLESMKKTALDSLAAIERHQEQTKIELRRAGLKATVQEEILKRTGEGHRLMREWAAVSIQAADAGLTLRNLRGRGLPAESAEQHFADMWNATSEANQAVINRATRVQKEADEILRK